MAPDELRQCKARWHINMSIRCQDQVTEMTVHTGPHWGLNDRGETVRWTEGEAVYPAIDGNFHPAADPDRVRFETKDSGVRAEFESGMVRDTQEGKARFELLLPLGVPYEDQFLVRVAELMGRGAEKYCKPRAIGIPELVELCTCDNQTAIRLALTTLRGAAETAMNAIFDSVTRSLRSASERTQDPGIEPTGTGSGPPIWPTVVRAVSGRPKPTGTADGLDTAYLQKMASDFFLRRLASVSSVETSSAQEVLTLITTMRPGWQEDFYALAVTRGWDSSETPPRAFGQHSGTCSILRLHVVSDELILENPRNWEKASGPEELERFKSSALRHLMQWAAGETDEDHAAAVVFNLLGYETTRIKIKEG